uniref:Uncharacterized protein n=1 Tax=Parascaris univalens TaxID=6257 RepID=A0A915BB28_PARUN
HWKDDFSKYDMQLIFYTMFTAKRLLPVCQAVAHRTPSRLPGRDVPILIKDVIAVEQNEGDLSSKVKYQLKQHIDDFFDFFSDILQLSHKDRRKAVGYRKFAFIQVKDIKLSAALPLAVPNSFHFAYAVFQRDIIFNWRLQTPTLICPASIASTNNRLANAAWLHFRGSKAVCDGGTTESAFQCSDEHKADETINYWTVVMRDERRWYGCDCCSRSEILKSADKSKVMRAVCYSVKPTDFCM